ncbi:MAG: WYL domain-containing protein [Candidatus Thiodiazotropha endolucinida]
MNLEKLNEISQSQTSRIFYLDFRMRFLGTITRNDLVNRFGIKEAAATRDIAFYRDMAPENIEYDAALKMYVRKETFQPAFEHNSEQTLLALTTGIGDDSMGIHKPLVSNELPIPQSAPDVNVLTAITSAIHQKHPAEIEYCSTTSGFTTRTVVPFSLFSNGLRWYVRAYDRKRESFLDFALTRTTKARMLADDNVTIQETREADNQWNRIVDLELVPHPNEENLAHPETIALDYHMSGGVLRLQVRAAIVGYLLRLWLVDCSENYRLKGNEYQLWLRNHPTLYGVESASLAPGYKTEGEL